MIAFAKPYPRRISPRLAVWAFKRTGLEPTQSGSGIDRQGCLLAALMEVLGKNDVEFIATANSFFPDYYCCGVICGWDGTDLFGVEQSQYPAQFILGRNDAIAARAALTAAGIV